MAAGTVCRGAAGDCDFAEACTGSSAACPPDTVAPGGAQCRAAAAPCDAAEYCDGIAPACPNDGMLGAGVVCRPAAGICDVVETCNGFSAPCPTDQLVPSGTICRAAANECDVGEVCSGADASCPADALQPDGTPCSDDGSSCTYDACAGSTCTHPDNGLCGACCTGAGCSSSLLESECTALGGTWSGAGSQCTELGACCVGSACLLADGACCLQLNGSYYGPDIGCLGDDNNNGIDGRCEEVAYSPCDQQRVQDDGLLNARVGSAVALGGEVAVLGADGDDGVVPATGAAYVYARVGTQWAPATVLAASDGAADDDFGGAVAISGDTVVVGAPQDDDDGVASGSAYVFRWTGSTWVQDAKLTALDAAAGDQFGSSVAISGDTVLIGAPYDDDRGTSSGSAYVFQRVGTVWTQSAKLNAPDGVANALFAFSLAMQATQAAIGAETDPQAAAGAGAVYVFAFDGVAWTQEAKLLASDAGAGNRLGHAVSISGDLVLAGASADSDSGANSGSAYVFRREPGGWAQEAKLLASDGAMFAEFGYAVSVYGNVAVVGARMPLGAGAMYTYRRIGTNWVDERKVTPPAIAAGDEFGVALSLFGRTAVVGARGADGVVGNSGAAYFVEIGGADCNQNGAPDGCDIARGLGTDCDDNGVLDACELTNNDTDGDGVLDLCDRCQGSDDAVDADGDGVPDGCDQCPGVDDGPDCDADAVPDCVEIGGCGGTSPTCADCNSNTVPDGCDIALGTSQDLDLNGVPDDCLRKPVGAPAPHNYPKNRYVSFAPGDAANPVAHRISQVAPVSAAVGWVGVPDANGLAAVTTAPVTRAWPEVVIHVGDCQVVPDALYEIAAEVVGVAISPPLPVGTTPRPSPKFWGDTVGELLPAGWSAPNGVVNINDFVAALKAFQDPGGPLSPHLSVVDVGGAGLPGFEACLNRSVNFTDVFLLVRAFQGYPYPFATVPAGCPACP
ncbi:MAG: hypothetical protein HY763_08795 [Planctomycetes bacterium]|nr:hypothetical protein [Planctomycetota bacterium]